MLTELVFILGWLSAGMLSLHAAGLRGWELVPVGFIVGASGYVAIAALTLIAAVPQLPVVALTLLLGMSGLWWLRNVPTAAARATLLVRAAVALPATAAVVAAARSARLVNYHFDSLEHAANTAMIATGRLTYTNTAYVQFRGIGFPLLHSPAPLVGDLYLASVGPLLALSTLGVLVWFTSTAAPCDANSRRTLLVGLVGALVLLTTNRVVFHAFYLHGHMITAATMLVLVAAGWAYALGTRPSLHRAFLMMQVTVLPALVLARPEAIAVAALAITPTLISPRIARGHRIAVASTYAAAAIAPQLFFIAEGYRVAGGPHQNTVALLILGLGTAGIAVLLALRDQTPTTERAWLRIAYLAIAAAAGGATYVAPEIMATSIRALWGNIAQGGGGWGSSFLLLAALLVVVLVVTELPQRHHLVFPILTFIPAALLFALARDGAYRVNPADSLNRMLLHILPLAVLVLTSTIVAGSNRWAGAHQPNVESGATPPQRV